MAENIIVTPQQRTAKINLGGKEYEMLLTTEAVMQNSNKIVEHDRAMWQLLFSQISHDIHPVLEDVSADEQE